MSEQRTFLRELFEKEYNENPALYYEDDYQRIMNDDNWVQKFLIARENNVNEAFKMLKETLKWRKDMVLNDIYDHSFPIEFYKIGAIFPYLPDKEGNLVVFMRICMHRKVPELDEYSRKFLVHNLEKADNLSEGHGIAIVFDLTNVSYVNIDWDYLNFIFNVGTNYYLADIKYMLVYNLPWFLNAFRKAAYTIIPKEWTELIKFCSGEEIFDYIPKENVPDYLGGTCKRNYRAAPPNSLPISSIVKEYGYTEDDIERIMPLYKEALEEAERSLMNSNLIDPVNYFQESTREKPTEKPQHLRSTQFISFFNNEGEISFFNPLLSPVAFKVQCTNPLKYSVSPRIGLLPYKSGIQIRVKRHDPSAVEKFRIIYTPFKKIPKNLREVELLFLKDLNNSIIIKTQPDNSDSNLTKRTRDFIPKLKLLNRKTERKAKQKETCFVHILVFIVMLAFFVGWYLTTLK